MKQNETKVGRAKNSNPVNVNKENENIQGANVESLDNVPVDDNTQTKGKATGKFNIVDDTEATTQIETPKKNEVFAQVIDFFRPVKFNWKECPELLPFVPLVESGVVKQETIQPSIDKAEKDFFAAHKAEIDAAENMTFAEFAAKLSENKVLEKKVFQVCNIDKLSAERYLSSDGAQVQIFRAAQCTDKDGNNRYKDVTLSATEDGQKFTANLFVEYRPITTSNIITAVRYYASKQDAQRRLLNQLADHRRILTNVLDAIKKAYLNGFTEAQILQAVETAKAHTV